ncbi:MAG: radical SAM protein [Smithellaceae bacterium]|nr:radical SAM protein [Smithellaceae bacterium]
MLHLENPRQMPWTLKRKYQEILSREKGLPVRSGSAGINICLAYPNFYRTGMSNLGFQTVYNLFNSQPGVCCERVFLPDPPDEEKLLQGGASLCSLESHRPLSDFDILAFSISFEGDYPNILKILRMGRISLERMDRPESEPLILGGGVAVTLNPEPLGNFFDLFLIGEGEELVPEFVARYLQCNPGFSAQNDTREGRCSREDLLITLQREVAGVYVPGFYGPDQTNPPRLVPLHPGMPARIRRRWISDPDSHITEECIHPAEAEFGDMYLLEVNRGCGRGCRFCAAGYLYRPVRFRSREVLADSLTRGARAKGKVGLIGTAVSDHPELVSIGRDILREGGKLGIGSLRMDRVSAELLQILKAGGVETIALAPEAGTDRLREVIKKGIAEEDIRRAVELLIDHAILNVRLYFMIGLPTETHEDIQGIIELTRKIKLWAREFSGGTRGFKRITLSINQFIPKPATPFQWQPLENISLVKKKLKIIKQALRREPAIEINHDLPKWNYIQALLSLGDRQVGALLLAVDRLGGGWPQAIKEGGLDPDCHVYRLKSYEETLPWEIIDHGTARELLIRECEKALS